METVKAKKKAKRTLYVWILILILVVVAGTWAWFNFQTSTNVEPNTAGTITDGDGGLKISNSPNGPFGDSCKLVFESNGGDLEPLSTANLTNFYEATAQNSKGISVLFADATDKVNKCTMHGKVYLKADTNAVNVFLYKNMMTFGNSTQALASMRLGMNITLNGSTKTYIFKLDDMGNTSGAEKQVTTTQEGVVVNSVNDGRADFVADPSIAITPYSAIGKSSTDKEPTAGKNKLISLKINQVATVEYWLYLEGCDENCINSVQLQDVELRLSFAGSTVD